MHMEQETKVLVISQKEIGKELSKLIADGWRVVNSTDASGRAAFEEGAQRVVLTKEYPDPKV